MANVEERIKLKSKVDERIKILPKVDRAKVIAGLGLLGGAILLIYGLTLTRIYYGVDEAFVFRQISGIVTVLWGSMALISSVIPLRGNRKGYIILLIAAIGGLVGNFIPIFSYDPCGYLYPCIQMVYLNSTAGYFDLVIMLIGGIYGVALPENKVR